MAIKPFVRTSTLQQSQAIVDKDGRPVAWFVRLVNDNNGNVVQAINQIAQLPAIQDALAGLATATAAAQAAADAAQSAADGANSSTVAQEREMSLQTSYVEPASVVVASPTIVTIAAHTRYYPQSSGAPVAVSVDGGTGAATAIGNVNYVSYVDPSRAGGTVTYIISTTPPTQTGDTHVVGAVTIPAAGSSSGGKGPLRPGEVEP